MSDIITVNIQEADKITCNIINGEVNTASSAGTGASIYYQKSGFDLQFNAIKSENNILGVTLDAATHDVEFTVDQTKIDHNSLANYVLGQHRIINDAGTSATELWSADKIDTAIGSISSSSISTAGTGMYTAEEAQILVGHSENTGTDYIMKLYEGTGTPVPVLQVDGGGNLFNNGNTLMQAKATGSVYIGTYATHSTATGNYNTTVGSGSGSGLTSGYENVFSGFNVGATVTQGFRNSLFGLSSGANTTTGDLNTFFGRAAGFRNIVGNNNTAFGSSAGFNALGSSNVFVGFNGGYYQTGSNKLVIDNQNRTNIATENTNALIVGDFHATPASQKITFNASIFNSVTKSGATQVGASAAANEIWKTASHATLPDNVLMIGV